MKLCLVCSQGGHFEQMMRLTEAFQNYNYFFVTFEFPSTAHLPNAYFLKFKGWDLKGKLLLINTIIKSFKILIKERPDLIITTGSGEIAVPFCYIGKLLGIKIVFIETLSRIESASSAAKLVYPIADLFLIQWEFNLKKYGSKAKYWGQII
jgi:UDP-N-acetylglucosamine:LPS N-acetylglucosamine transferase